MNDDVLDALLMYCLDELEAGVPATEILARYPDQAEVIRPLLEMAARLNQLAPEPPQKAQANSKAVFLAHARVMKKAYRQPRLGNAGWRRLVFALGAIVLLFVVFLAVSDQTASALPGSALYPVKRAAEDLRLSLTENQQSKDNLRAQYDAERVDEINTLITIGREAQVECHGTIDKMGPDTWVLCGLIAVVNDQTIIMGNPFMGAAVHVTGIVADGRFTVIRINVLSENEENEATPLLPTATPTNTPTATNTPLPPTPTDTAVPDENTPTPSFTPTHTVTPTPTEEIEETETPELEDETPEPEEEEDLTPEPAEVDETPEAEEDNSGPGGGDDDNSGSGSSGSNSGSGSGDDGNSGSGSGSNSGSGSGSNSGSGSGSNSGSGSGN